MPIYLLPSLIISLFAVGYTPGPANIYILSCVLSHGKRAAMRCWFGLFCGFSTAALLAAVAAYFAELALGVYIVYIKYLGASYMVYLAWKCYRSNISGGEGVKCSFWSGFIVQISNAKMILFNLTVYSSFASLFFQVYRSSACCGPFAYCRAGCQYGVASGRQSS